MMSTEATSGEAAGRLTASAATMTAPGVHVEPLYEEQVVLVARRRRGHARARLSRDALAAARHVAIEMAPGRGVRDRAAAVYARAGIRRDVAIVVPTFTAAAAVAAATDLVATLPASLFDVLGARLGLQIVETPVPPFTVTMNLCWHDPTHTDPAMAAFRDLVRRAGPASGPRRRRRS
jgi:DNA-binding transcriptional LysR family regulator